MQENGLERGLGNGHLGLDNSRTHIMRPTSERDIGLHETDFWAYSAGENIQTTIITRISAYGVKHTQVKSAFSPNEAGNNVNFWLNFINTLWKKKGKICFHCFANPILSQHSSILFPSLLLEGLLLLLAATFWITIPCVVELLHTTTRFSVLTTLWITVNIERGLMNFYLIIPSEQKMGTTKYESITMAKGSVAIVGENRLHFLDLLRLFTRRFDPNVDLSFSLWTHSLIILWKCYRRVLHSYLPSS